MEHTKEPCKHWKLGMIDDWDNCQYCKAIADEKEYDELKQQRDELERENAKQAELLNKVIEQRDELMAAAVAVRADLVRRAEFDSEDGGLVLNISNGVLMQLDDAIAKVKP